MLKRIAFWIVIKVIYVWFAYVQRLHPQHLVVFLSAPILDAGLKEQEAATIR